MSGSTNRERDLFVTVLGALALGTWLTAQTPPEFEVSSIKRNLGTSVGTNVRQLPDGTYSATNQVARRNRNEIA